MGGGDTRSFAIFLLSEESMIPFHTFISLFLFLLPFQFALSPSAGMDLPFGKVLAGIIFLWWLVRSLARKDIELPPLFFTGVFLSLLGILLASFLWAENREFSFRKALFLLNFIPLILVFFDLGREKGVLLRWSKALCVGAGSVALLGLGIFSSQFLFGVEKVFLFLKNTLPFFLGSNLAHAVAEYPSLLVNIGGVTLLRVSGLFPDPHVASFYFGMCAFLALGIFFREKKYIFLLVSVLLFLADLFTFSRGGYIGLFTASLLFFFCGWSIFALQTRKRILWCVLILLVLTLFFGQPIASRFISSFSLADTSSTERIELWQVAFQNIQARPFFGTGIGNYIVAVRPADEYRIPYYAHNLYLDIATELGLVGLFFFLLLFCIPLFLAIRTYKQTKNIFSLCLVSALLLYLSHSFFETALFSVHVLPLLIFVLAGALILSDQRKGNSVV